MQLALAPVQNLFNSYATISSGTGMRQQYKTLIFTALAAAISFGHANAADDDLGFLFEDDSDSQVEVEPAESPAAEDEGQQANDATQPDDSDTAASETEEADAPVASGEKRLILEEIVVTAQKRAQVLADVPVSLTAISGEKLTDAGIENLSDMSEYTPNFKLVDSGLIPNIYMRGVGSGSNQGFELSVGMFSDGIHLGRPHQTRAAFMDVQRVEVLRGPQSILFGKNAIAGALNIISATPGDEFESILSGSLGLPHQDAEISAVISGPINDQFGARLAVRQRGENGYIYNRAQGRDEPSTDELATRGTFTWAPSDAFDSSLKLEHTRRVQNGRTFQPTDPGALTGCSGEETNFDLSRNTNEAERAVIEAYNATLNVSIPVGESTLTVVTGASGFDSSDLYDADASEFDTIYLLGDEFYDQVSTEIRFASPIGNFVDYIFGVFYQQGDLLFNEFGPLIARAGALGDQGNCNVNTTVIAEADLYRNFTIESKAWSAFGQATFNFTDSFRSTVGMRYVKETKDGFRQLDVYEPGTRDDVNPVTAAALDQLLIRQHTLSGNRDVGILLPSVNFQWDVTNDVMSYLTATRGAKSGSFDARNNNDNTGPSGGGENFEFEDEVADAFELGAKMTLADGRADLNIAAYLVNYSELQVSVFDGVAGFTVTNAGEAKIQGIEIDGRFLASEHLLFTGALAFLDFEWTDYVDGPCHINSPNPSADGTCDLTGRENQQTPPWTASLSGLWTNKLTQALNIDLTLDANYRDTHFTSGDLDPRGQQQSHVKYNTRVSIGPEDDNWAIAVVGKNLTDERTIGIGAPIPLDKGGFMATTERNRTFSLEGRVRF